MAGLPTLNDIAEILHSRSLIQKIGTEETNDISNKF